MYKIVPAAAVAVGCLIGASVGLADSQQPSVAFPLAEAAFPARLVGIDREWNLSFQAGGKVRVIAAAELAYWGRYRDAERGPQIVLRDGSVIRSDVLLIDERQLVVGDATGLGRGQWDESSLPKETILGVVFQPPAGPADRDKLFDDIRLHQGADDRLLLVGGESIAGSLVAAPRAGRFAASDAKPGAESFELARRGGQSIHVPAAKVVAISFATLSPPIRPASRFSSWLGLNEGSLVQGTSLTVRGDVVTIGLAAGGELKTTLTGRDDVDKKLWDAVTYIEPTSSRVTWLSDVTPLGYKHIPFVSVERPFGSDHCVLGSRLRWREAVIRKGLGMPSASRLAYDVDGYRKFEAEVAVDEAAGLRGSVVFKVLLETAANQWQTAYASPVVRGGDAPLPISVDLKSASRMALLVEFADRGDECDYADWLHARLISAAAK